MRRFVKNHSACFTLQTLQMLAPALAVHGEKTLECEPPARKAAHAQRGDARAAAGNRDDLDARRRADRGEVLARVGNGWRSGVGDLRAALPGEDAREDHLPALAPVMLKITHKRL